MSIPVASAGVPFLDPVSRRFPDKYTPQAVLDAVGAAEDAQTAAEAAAASIAKGQPDGVGSLDADGRQTAAEVPTWLTIDGLRARALLNAPYARPTVLNRKNLIRFQDALKTKTNPVITCLGNSITWGVGTDDLSATSTGFQENYRQHAWPSLLRKRIAQARGLQPRENHVLLDGYSGYATLAGGATLSQTIGAFGGYGAVTGDATRGGVSLPSSTATVTIPSTKTGRFTEVDVLYWGTGGNVSGGYSPNVLVDGATVHTGGVAFTGNIGVITITGLSNAGHEITIAGTGTNPTWLVGVVFRGAGEVVVNRVAAPGVHAGFVLGQTGWTTQQRTRQADAAVLAGYSDLVIISLTANEVYQQYPIADYTSSMTTIVNRAVAGGACVLLMGDPAVSNEEGYAIKGSHYRAALIAISNSNSHVAYADFNAVFGDREVAQAAGMWSAPGSVHPSREGHRRMADFIYEHVLPGASI